MPNKTSDNNNTFDQIKKAVNFYGWEAKKDDMVNPWSSTKQAGFGEWGIKKDNTANSWGSTKQAGFGEWGVKKDDKANSWGSTKQTIFGGWGTKENVQSKTWTTLDDKTSRLVNEVKKTDLKLTSDELKEATQFIILDDKKKTDVLNELTIARGVTLEIDEIKQISELIYDSPQKRRLITEQLHGRKVPLENLKEFVNIIPTELEKVNFLVEYAKNYNSEYTINEIKELSGLIKGEGEINRLIVENKKAFNKKYSFEELTEIAPLIKTDKNRIKFLIVEILDIESEFTLNHLKSLSNQFKDDEHKFALFRLFIDLEKDEDKKYSKFIEVLKNNKIYNLYSFENIASVYKVGRIPLKKIPDALESLYLNMESCQVGLLDELLNENLFDKTDENISIIKKSIKNFISDENVSLIMDSINEHLNLSPLDTISLSKGRFRKLYSSIANTLNEASLEKSLNNEGLSEINKLFGNNDITLVEAFSYFDIKNKIDEFTKLLKPEFSIKLQEQFKFDSNKAYVTEQEKTKIGHLLGKEQNLQPVQIIANSLKEFVKIDKITNEGLARYKIPDLQEAPELETKFKGILSNLLDSGKLDGYSAVGFVKELFAYTQGVSVEKSTLSLSEKDETNLAQFFEGNIDEIATVFKREGGVESLINSVRSLGDGCVANISTKFKESVYGVLIDDPVAREIYKVYSIDIAGKIINSGKDILDGAASGAATDILSNETITLQSYISPAGFCSKLVENLSERDMAAWSFINEDLLKESSYDLSNKNLLELLEIKDANDKANIEKELKQYLGGILLEAIADVFEEGRIEEKDAQFLAAAYIFETAAQKGLEASGKDSAEYLEECKKEFEEVNPVYAKKGELFANVFKILEDELKPIRDKNNNKRDDKGKGKEEENRPPSPSLKDTNISKGIAQEAGQRR